MKKTALLAALVLLPTWSLAEVEFSGDFDLEYSTNGNKDVGDWSHTSFLFETALKADRVELSFGGSLNRIAVDGSDATINTGELRGQYHITDNVAIEAGLGKLSVDRDDNLDVKSVRVRGDFGNFVAAAGTYRISEPGEGRSNFNELYLGYDYSDRGRVYFVVADGSPFTNIKVLGLKHLDESWGVDASLLKVEDLNFFFVKGHYNLNEKLLLLGEISSGQIEGLDFDSADLGLGYRFRPSTYAYATVGKQKGDGFELNRVSFGVRHMIGKKSSQTPSIFDYVYEPIFSQGIIGR